MASFLISPRVVTRGPAVTSLVVDPKLAVIAQSHRSIHSLLLSIYLLVCSGTAQRKELNILVLYSSLAPGRPIRSESCCMKVGTNKAE